MEILSKLRVNKETTASDTQQTLMIHPGNQHMNGKAGKAMTQNTEKRIFKKSDARASTALHICHTRAGVQSTCQAG